METTARFYLERIRDQIDQARRYRYPTASDAPAKWLNLIAGKLAGVQDRLSDREYHEDREKAEGLLVDLSSCYDDLQILERADTAHVAEFVVSALYRLFNKIDPDCDYLFASGINFEVAPLYDGPPPMFHDDHRRAVKLMKTILYRITMPGGALGAAFHIPLVAHEVGHIFMSKLERDNEDDDPINKICEENSTDEIYKEWAKEIIADTICGFVAGPAGFFALYEKLRGGGDEPDEEYPHNSIRLSSLSDYIKNNFRTVFDEHNISDEKWKNWITSSERELLVMEYTGKNKYDEKTDYTKTSHQLIKALPRIREATLELARKNISEFEYTPDKLKVDLKSHLELFLNAIPPFETPEDIRSRKPTELFSILNIGWFVAAFTMDRLKITASDGSNEIGGLLVCLDQIILKAIELSEIRRAWVGA